MLDTVLDTKDITLSKTDKNLRLHPSQRNRLSEIIDKLHDVLERDRCHEKKPSGEGLCLWMSEWMGGSQTLQGGGE